MIYILPLFVGVNFHSVTILPIHERFRRIQGTDTMLLLRQQLQKGLQFTRLTKQKSLELITSQYVQRLHLGVRLNTFGDRLEFQALSQQNDRPNHRIRIVCHPHLLNK